MKFKKTQPEMPALRAYLRGELTAQSAINRADHYEESIEIMRAANSRAQRIDTAHPNAPGNA
jgi:hypothetical protein